MTHTLKRKPTQPTRDPKSTSPALIELVSTTLPAVKQPDEFTLVEFMAAARKIGRPVSERAALNVLAKQVKLNLLATRRTTVEGHTAKVWRRVIPK